MIVFVILWNELEVKGTTDSQISASSRDLDLEIDNGGILKTKLYDKHDDITFPIVNFPFNSSSLLPLVKITIDSRVFQHHHHMEFTFHNSCDILGLVPSTLIFRTDISCWRKSYSNKNSTVVITITVTKYLYLKWRLIIYYLRR
jgi:hypothetical protein